MTDTARLPTSQVATLGVIGLALLIGVILAVRLAARPAYEAAAEITVAVDDPSSEFVLPDNQNRPAPDLAEEQKILVSTRVANDAESLAVAR